MNNEPMSLTTFLTASVAGGIVLGAPFAFVLSLVLLRLYRGRVVEQMNRIGRGTGNGPGTGAGRAARAPRRVPTASAAELFVETRRGPRRDLGAYAAAVSAYALVMTIGNRAASGVQELYPVQLVTLLAGYAFPFVPMFALIRGTGRSLVQAAAAYLAFLALLGAAASLRGASFGAPFAFLAINALPTLAIGAMFTFRNGRVGPLVYGFVLCALLGPNVAMLVLDRNVRTVAEVAAPLGMSAMGVVGAMLGAGLVTFVAAGLTFLTLLRRSYLSKWISDRTLALDSLLLPYALTHGATMMFDAPRTAVASLVIGLVSYRLVATVAQRASIGPASNGAPSVLFLRVFRASGRRDLFDRWSADWRYVGTVRMIAGPDLATAVVEPHEFLDFVFGRLATRFVEGETELERALEREDRGPDLDGRYRTSSYFCRANTWEMVFRRLAADSDAVVMDIRGFDQRSTGARVELETVAAQSDLRRVVLIVDRHTDMELVDALLGAKRGAVRVVQEARDVDRILGAISSAAAPDDAEQPAA